MIKSINESIKLESPAKLRVQQLADRLFQLQAGLEEEKNTRVESFHAKLASLETKIDSSCLNFESKFNNLTEQLAKINETIINDRASQVLLDERKTKELKLVENSLQIDLNLLKQSRKEQENKVTKVLDDKIFPIKSDLAKEKQTREEFSEQYSIQLSESIERLHAVVEEETNARQEGMEDLNTQIIEEIQKFEDELYNEKRDRDEANASLIKILEDMQDRLLQEISSEKIERENTQETLIKLLEETCHQVESSLRS